MAIFASTTTSGYSDPLKAYSIKALEARQKDMQAQMAAEQARAFTPENTQTPIQGFGQVANVAVDAMRQNRLDRVAAAQRDELSSLIAGTKPGEDLSPQAQARMAVVAPDMYKEMLTQMAERRKQQALFGQQDKARVEDAAIAQKAAEAQEARTQARPSTTDVAQLRRAITKGEITKEEGEAAIKKLTSPSASEQKIINDQAMQSADTQSALGTLNEALALTQHPKGIHAGNWAGGTQSIGEMVPKALQGKTDLLPDPETTKNTQRYNQIMGAQALQLLTQMKGASSDKDVAINFKIANDPNASIESKRQAIQVLQTKLAAYLEIHNRGITEAGGTVPKLGGSSASPAAGPAAATPAAAPGNVVEVPDEAAALKLEPGTKFRLKDGRTGTAR